MGRLSNYSSSWRRRAVVASAGLTTVLSAALLVFSAAPAAAATTADIGSQFIGTTAGPCTGSTDTTWTFILNQLDTGTQAGTLTATFTPAFSQTVTGVPEGNGQNQHFIVTTPGNETLQSAS